jgi:hypothetical protein
VLIPTWYSGNHGVARDTYVGAGRAIDPDLRVGRPLPHASLFGLSPDYAVQIDRALGDLLATEA